MEIIQAMELISYEVLYQDVRFMDEQIEQIKQVTAEDVKRVANEWLGFSISFELRPSNT
jgi:predicted Zn-dependent peptidase